MFVVIGVIMWGDLGLGGRSEVSDLGGRPRICTLEWRRAVPFAGSGDHRIVLDPARYNELDLRGLKTYWEES